MLKELKTNKQSSFTNVFDFLKLYDNHFRFKKRISVGSGSKFVKSTRLLQTLEGSMADPNPTKIQGRC